MKERTACSPCPVYDLFRQNLKVVAVISLLITDNVNEPCPATS
jgi:hypothetical protein